MGGKWGTHHEWLQFQTQTLYLNIFPFTVETTLHTELLPRPGKSSQAGGPPQTLGALGAPPHTRGLPPVFVVGTGDADLMLPGARSWQRMSEISVLT